MQDNPKASLVSPAGIVDAASYASGAPLAPGSIISVFGGNLVSATSSAPSVPLPTTLGGATLSVGNVDMPLFFSSNGQINAQLPFEVAAATRPQVVVRTQPAGGATLVITVPETITIAATRPAIFTTNQKGTGQGAIVNLQGQTVDGSAPATEGDTVLVFATGLGATNPAVPSGQAGPSTPPLAQTVLPVQAQVGGQRANVPFAGLAPFFVGLYQLNVEIPVGVQPGPAVPLVVLVNGVPSNTVALAIR